MSMSASVGKPTGVASTRFARRASGVTWYCRMVVRVGMGSPPPMSVSASTRKAHAPASSVLLPVKPRS